MDSFRHSQTRFMTGEESADRQPLLRGANASSTPITMTQQPTVDFLTRQRWKDAAQKRAECLRNWCSDSPFKQTPLDSPVLENGEAGIGLSLFFHQLKEYTVAFAAMSILAIIAMIDYGTGPGPALPDEDFAEVNDNPSGLIVISITNLGDDRPSSTLLVADLIFSIFFVIFVYLQKHFEQERILKMPDFKMSSPFYTVEIRGLPKLSYKEQELSEFFSKYGEVHKTAVVSLPADLIRLRAEVARARSSLDHAIALEAARLPKPWYYSYLGLSGRQNQGGRMRAFWQSIGLGRDSVYWSQYISQLEADIKVAETEKPNPIGRAFVTFENIDSAIQCKEVYMRSRFVRTCQLIWCYSGPPKFRYRTLEALDAPEPLDIIWENLGYGNFSRFVRQLGTFLTCFVLIGISLLINSAILDQEDNPNVGYPFVVALFIGTLNYLLTAFLCAVVPYERHHSHTGLQTGLCAKIFFVTLLNSSLSVLLACLLSANEGFSRDRDVDGDDFFKIPDFVEGYSLVVLGIVAGPLIRRALLPTYYNMKVKRALPYCFNRRDYDEAYRNPSFNLAEAYAYSLEVIFICLALSSIVPIVLVIGFIGLVLHYFVCKFLILRVSGPPPPYEVKLALRLERLLPSCITLHMLIASICYSAQGVDYEGSILESVVDGRLFSRAFQDGDDTQDHILVLYWVVTLILVFWNFVIPWTPIYWIFAYFKLVGREQMVVTQKAMKSKPISFTEAMRTNQATLYDPPVAQDDAEDERSAKVERYLQRTLTRLQGVVRWLPENSPITAEELWTNSIA
eukprot:TRINITY_DN4760_c0_g3_i1.p1 TRINITY_DN4760_c0_g3~~TRINITY_DN4760_c0_g3_i1.p1  ORF type:complete len:793 (-),score=158.08 TRINITY_DN4760_c0_g3_i1:412-2790(-)